MNVQYILFGNTHDPFWNKASSRTETIKIIVSELGQPTKKLPDE